jgi:hypothetical protein
MSTMVFDEAGSRYYETGISRGIFFPIDGSAGVPWNGLVAVAVDPTGGEPEHYYHDGLKFMDRILAEDFQGTIQALTTPKEFEPCEGIRPLKGSFGGKTFFNQRRKFNMAWRTEIGSDEGERIAYKLHIAYNCLVQPAGRNYQTISDNTSMDLRTFVITTTPACGRYSYFVFDSREGDLTALENTLYSGVLPRCWELGSLTAALDGDEGGPAGDPTEDCPSLLVDFEEFNPGQSFDAEEFVSLDDFEAWTITGTINNGMDILELPATGAYAANDSAASEVGTGDILADGDDATYITSADGDLGYTIALPSLVGYVPGCEFELHIRASITGGINEDDPTNLDADMQVHISTDADGDDTIGGFSDGTDEGMGFSLTDVEGAIVDYVIPLSMDAWVDTTLDDVVTALEAGAYLNVVGASNNNFDTTPEVRVYEASVVMINATDQDRWLRTSAPDENAYLEGHVRDASHVDLQLQTRFTLDFKLLELVHDDTATPQNQDLMKWDMSGEDSDPGVIRIESFEPQLPIINWLNDSEVSNANLGMSLELNKWYRMTLVWGSESTSMVLFDREANLGIPGTSVAIFNVTSPRAFAKLSGGMIVGETKTYELVLDNFGIETYCHTSGEGSES